MDTYKIKACNPDNELEVARLITTFRDSYGEQFPFRGVYDREFWHRSAGSRLMSLLAVNRHEVLAHLAARPEPHNPQTVQICFPACADGFQSEAVSAARQAWKMLSSVAERQQWHSIYFGSFSDIELMQRIGLEALEVSTCAILPGYIPVQNPRCASRRGNALSTRSHVAVGSRTLISHSGVDSPLFIPERHRDIVTELLTSAGRADCLDRLSAPTASSATISADSAQGIEQRFMRDWESLHILVRPGKLDDFSQPLNLAREYHLGSPFIFVDARDPRCPAMCDHLEANGFGFCGILPDVFGTETLAYSHSDAPIDARDFICPQARRLAHYMTENDSVRPVATKTTRRRQAPAYATARI